MDEQKPNVDDLSPDKLLESVARGDQLTPNQEQRFLEDTTNLIRLYLSSPGEGEDTVHERAFLLEKIVPELREYFYVNYGLEFQLIDMRWGLNGAKLEREICLKEIDYCRRFSRGPFFLGLMTDLTEHSETMQDELSRAIMEVDEAEVEERVILVIRNTSDSKKPQEKIIKVLERMKDKSNLLELNITLPSSQTKITPESYQEYFKNFGEKTKERIIASFEKQLPTSPRATKFGVHSPFSYLTTIEKMTVDEYSDLIEKKNALLDQITFVESNYYERVKEFVLSDDKNEPLYIYGESGVGKSTFAAMLAQKLAAESKNGSKTSVLYRFANTNCNLSSTGGLLGSLISQINRVKHWQQINNFHNTDLIKRMENYYFDSQNSLDDFCKLSKVLYSSYHYYISKFFPKSGQLVEKFKETFSYPRVYIYDKTKPKDVVVVIIDSVDQLRNFDEYLKSTLITGDSYNVFKDYKVIFLLDSKTIKSALTFSSNSFELKPTVNKESIEAILKRQKNTNDKIKDQDILDFISQKYSLGQSGVNSFENYLHAAVVVHLLRSYGKDDFQVEECSSLEKSIRHLLKRLEKEFGEKFLTKIAFYMKELNGMISDDEAEDILSLDDDFLNSLAKQNTSQLRRFPVQIWLRFKHRVGEFLSTIKRYNMADRTCLLSCWSNVIFAEIFNETYLKNLSSSEVYLMRMNIYHYFMGTFREKEKTFLVDTAGQNKDLNNLRPIKSTRLTKNQKLIIRPAKWKDNLVYNVRKLDLLAYLVVKLGLESPRTVNNDELVINALKKSIYFDQEFILAKILCRDQLDFVDSTFSLVWHYYNMYLNQPGFKDVNPIEELVLMNRFYRDNMETILTNPNSIKFISKACLLDCTTECHVFLKNFCQLKSTAGLELTPLYSYLPVALANDNERTTFSLPEESHHRMINKIFRLPKHLSYIVLQRTDLTVFDFKQSRIVKRVDLNKFNYFCSNVFLICASDSSTSFPGNDYRLVTNTIEHERTKRFIKVHRQTSGKPLYVEHSLEISTKGLFRYLIYPEFIIYSRGSADEIRLRPFDSSLKETKLPIDKPMNRIYSNLDLNNVYFYSDKSQQLSRSMLLIVLFCDAELRIYQIAKNELEFKFKMISTISESVLADGKILKADMDEQDKEVREKPDDNDKENDEEPDGNGRAKKNNVTQNVFLTLERNSFANSVDREDDLELKNPNRIRFGYKLKGVDSLFLVEIVGKEDGHYSRSFKRVDFEKFITNFDKLSILDFLDNLILISFGEASNYCLNIDNMAMINLNQHGFGRLLSLNTVLILETDTFKIVKFDKFKSADHAKDKQLIASCSFKSFSKIKGFRRKTEHLLTENFYSNNHLFFSVETQSGTFKFNYTSLTKAMPMMDLENNGLKAALKSKSIKLNTKPQVFNKTNLLYVRKNRVGVFDASKSQQKNEDRIIEGLDVKGKVQTVYCSHDTIVLTCLSGKAIFLNVFVLDTSSSNGAVKLKFNVQISQQILDVINDQASKRQIDRQKIWFINYQPNTHNVIVYRLKRNNESGSYDESLTQFLVSDFFTIADPMASGFYIYKPLDQVQLSITNSNDYLLIFHQQSIFLFDIFGPGTNSAKTPRLLLEQPFPVEITSIFESVCDLQEQSNNNFFFTNGPAFFYSTLTQKETEEREILMNYEFVNFKAHFTASAKLKVSSRYLAYHDRVKGIFIFDLVDFNKLEMADGEPVFPQPFKKIEIEYCISEFDFSSDSRYFYFLTTDLYLHILSLNNKSSTRHCAYAISFFENTNHFISMRDEYVTLLDCAQQSRRTRQSDPISLIISSAVSLLLLDDQHENYEKHLKIYKEITPRGAPEDLIHFMTMCNPEKLKFIDEIFKSIEQYDHKRFSYYFANVDQAMPTEFHKYKFDLVDMIRIKD